MRSTVAIWSRSIVFAAVLVPNVAFADYWIWNSGIDCAGPTSFPNAGEGSTTYQTNGLMVFDLRIPPNAVVDSLMVCFSSNLDVNIQATRLVETHPPNLTVDRLDDNTNRSGFPGPTCYSLNVSDFSPTGPLCLRLNTFSGTFVIHMIGVKIKETLLAVSGDPRPSKESLELRNTPNPFDGGTSIEFTLAHPGPVTLQVFDGAGRMVRTLAEEGRSAGPQRILWDRRGDDGRTVEPGVYFYELVTNGARAARKAIVLR